MIAVERVDKIEVFRNQDGDIVILQYDPALNEEAVIWFPTAYADAVIRGIEEARKQDQSK